jgi:IS30 family transposase
MNKNNGSLVLDLTAVDRKTALKAWLAYHEMDLFFIAGRIGVAHSTVTRLLKRDKASYKRVGQLRALGIPGELLPQPK